MHKAQDHYPDCSDALIVSLARAGDSDAFKELVKRKQSWIRNLMRRCCNDWTLADDLAQQVFLQAWLKLRTLRETNAFAAWLKRLAISVWLQHVRKKDALHHAVELPELERPRQDRTGMSMDLDRALAALSTPERLSIVLSYHEGMSHAEIADALELPLGTVKSHIKRGSQRLKQTLSAYRDEPDTENS